jgi:hypothetical protein
VNSGGIHITHFPRYIFKAKNRQKFSHRKSGGIAFGYKEKLDKFITIIKNDNTFVFWVKVSSTLFKLHEDVLIGVVYIPPEFTSYSSQEAFNDIDFDVDDTFTQNTNVLSFFIIFINLSNFSLYPKAIPPDFLCENFCLFFVLNIYPGKLIW